MKRFTSLARFATALPILFVFSSPANAHEAWLLTPSEIEDLSVAPIPPLFRSQLWLGIAALAGFGLTLVALRLEPVIADVEERVVAPIAERCADVGPLFLRLGLAVMLLLAAFGGLPRHGTDIWTMPTFLVPDMQLVQMPGADALIVAQIIVGAFLVAGMMTRLCGVALIVFSLLGPALFGPSFWSYSLHFIAPGLILIVLGGGRIACDHLLGFDAGERAVFAHRQLLWRVAQILIGVGFVYLGIAYKLLQPTLLIAILDHGGMPTFGLPMAVIALVMTGVEILCGALLVTGRLVRPVALAILGAVTFLAVVLGETPLFHANLYGALVVIFLAGRHVPFTPRHTRFQAVGMV